MDFYTNITRHFDDLLVCGYKDGLKYSKKIPYRPYLFVQDKTKQSKYVTLKGRVVDKIEFESMSECNQFIKKYKDVSGFEIFGMKNFQYVYLHDNYTGDIQYDASLVSVVTIDIEVSIENGFPNIEQADQEITAITLRKGNEIQVLGCGNYTPSAKNITYIKCRDEQELLMKFVDVWRRMDPDIITGWNVEFFDIPYIINRVRRVLGKQMAYKLSPWNIISERQVNTFLNKESNTLYEIAGISVLDYFQLYKKFSYKQQESYRLDYIAHVELGQKKLDYSEYSSLQQLYTQDFQKFIDYNVKDVDLVYALDEKMKFIEQVMAIAYSGKVNYIDTFTSVKMWDVIIHNYLLDQNIVVPQAGVNEKTEQIIGAYVKDPQVGMHNWVASFDVNSLYPMLIIQYNISPETLIGKIDKHFTIEDAVNGIYNDKTIRGRLKGENLTITANGALFDRDRKGFLPKLMDMLYSERAEYKNKMVDAKKILEQVESGKHTEQGYTKQELIKKYTMLVAQYNNNQMARKIILNSGYGALSNAGFRYYDDTLAEAITVSGQLSIRWTEKKMNEYLNKVLKSENVDYVIACDTDSMYLDLNKLVKLVVDTDDTDKIIDFLNNVCEQKLEPLIDKGFDELARYANCFEQRMKMKREVLANKGIWTAKKRYILNVFDSEGVRYSSPKLKIMGLEAIKTSTPSACREMIKKTFELIMATNEQTVIKAIDKFKKEFRLLPFEDIAFPRGCSDLEKYRDNTTIYKKATPIHVKGALLYNHHIRKLNKHNMYGSVTSGDKVKYSYLKVPNPIQDTVIACPDGLPDELDLKDYIDYDTQFEKAYLEPIKTILDTIGWKTKNVATLEAFF